MIHKVHFNRLNTNVCISKFIKFFCAECNRETTVRQNFVPAADVDFVGQCTKVSPVSFIIDESRTKLTLRLGDN